MQRKVTTIPATKSKYTREPKLTNRKRRVCGYARVSTDHEEQETSYEAQMSYYEDYIKRRADWEFAGMYSDEGITGTNTKKRDGFNRMVKDALDGKVDLIITKSVSRFARNTVDSLTTIRKLKEHGTEVYFEKENIWTMDAKGELLITIMSSLAQEESRNISENTTWGWRRRCADGKASVGFSRFLGYDQGPDGEWVINEEQAETVRMIFKLYLSGLSWKAVAEELEAQGRKAPAGGDKWAPSTVGSILQNEKYKGDALLQKEYTVDYLSKKKAKNNGEVPQYYVEGHHPPIVDARTFELAQSERKRRTAMGKTYSGKSIFASKIICGECGGLYGSKVWHSNDKYRKVIWRCNAKYGKKAKCTTPHVTDDELKDGFVKAYNDMISKRDTVIDDLTVLKDIRCNTEVLKAEMEGVSAELTALVKQTERLIADNAKVARNQAEYEKKYTDLTTRYEEKKAEYDRLNGKIESAKAAGAEIDNFVEYITENGTAITEFDEELWGCMVETVTVQADGSMEFLFKSGYKVTV